MIRHPAAQLLGAALAGVALATLAGCAPDSSPPVGGDGTTTPDIVETASPPLSSGARLIEQAEDDGASPEQLAMLRDAVEEDYLALADLQLAVQNTFECFQHHNISYMDDGLRNNGGMMSVSYHYGPAPGMTEAQSLALADQCMDEHSGFLEIFYMTQSSAVELQDAYFVAMWEPLAECLEGMGATVDPDLSTWDLIDFAFEWGGPGGGDPGVGASCYFDVEQSLPGHTP